MWQKIFKRHKMHSCVLATTAHKWSFLCAKFVNVYVVFCIKNRDLFDLYQYLSYFCTQKKKLIFKNEQIITT